MKVRWSRRATDDLIGQTAYIARTNPALARRIGRTIKTMIDRLEEFPYRGRPGEEDETREFVLPGLPWIAIYEVHQDVVMVVRLVHGAQNWTEDSD